MDTTTSSAIVSAFTTGIGSIVSFVTGSFLGVLIGLIVVGIAIGLVIRQFRKNAHKVVSG